VLTNERFTVHPQLRSLLTDVKALNEVSAAYVVDAGDSEPRRNRVLIVRRVITVEDESRRWCDSTPSYKVKGYSDKYNRGIRASTTATTT
jgi:hypothetical protein